MTDLPDRLSAALADRYTIERELGEGGMATVYLAHDVKHNRKVAVKVLRPELAAALGADRFLREIETTAQLHHPHILSLYDSGEAGGFLFYVMPFVEGESLRDRLDREKQLPVDQAVRITREVADALSYAHSRGVIHRDVKPENILLASGHAIVADFGIAKAVSAAGGTSLTETGMTVGTALYMSPEQAAGEQDLDGRSDLYSLGCVLYEMLAGQPPFTGPTLESVIRQHIAAEPRAITVLRPAVPADVAGLLARVLAKTPADRFSPAAAFAEALEMRDRPAVETAPSRTAVAPAPTRRWVWPVAVTALVAVVAVVAVLLRGSGFTTGDARPTVVVLPFENMGAPEDEYFADGMTEEITSRLAKISGIGVTSRTTALGYKGTGKTLREVGEELEVAYVLEGTVRTDRAPDGPGQVRVTQQLIRVSDDTHLWSESYTASLVPGEVFAVQSAIAEQVATALDVQLLGAERQAVRQVLTSDREAYDAYLQGRFQWNKRTTEAMAQAVEHFTVATERDAQFAQAWAGLADAYALAPLYQAATVPRADAYRRAEDAARRAVALDSTLAEAHASLAFARMYGNWDFDGAAREFREAIRLDPDYPVARYWYAELLMVLGRYDEAVEQARRGVELAPAAAIAQHLLGWALIEAGSIASGVAAERRAVELEPDFWFPYGPLARFAEREGRYQDARRFHIRGGAPPPFAEAFILYAKDPKNQARAIELIAGYVAGGTPPDPANVATAYGAIGAADSAVAWYERGFEERTELTLLTIWDAFFAPEIMNDPRIIDLQRRMGLPVPRPGARQGGTR
jgi:serine/threonine-protein kinase